LNETIDEIVGRNVAAQRVRRRWSQTELGKRLGLHQESISRSERGMRPFSYAEVLALTEVFDVELWELSRPDRHVDSVLVKDVRVHWKSLSRRITGHEQLSQEEVEELMRQMRAREGPFAPPDPDYTDQDAYEDWVERRGDARDVEHQEDSEGEET
jgi:transcriptional regulator with XRE-family HTH domain